MDARTGKIYTNQEIEELFGAVEENGNLFRISKNQERVLTPMNASQRKGYMRNQPCVCGSGKKFKTCCWRKYSKGTKE